MNTIPPFIRCPSRCSDRGRSLLKSPEEDPYAPFPLFPPPTTPIPYLAITHTTKSTYQYSRTPAPRERTRKSISKFRDGVGTEQTRIAKDEQEKQPTSSPAPNRNRPKRNRHDIIVSPETTPDFRYPLPPHPLATPLPAIFLFHHQTLLNPFHFLLQILVLPMTSSLFLQASTLPST